MPDPNLSRYADQLAVEIHWVSSDQLQEFDDIFALPVDNLERFRRHVRSYLDFVSSLSPEDPATLADDRFARELEALESEGEDVDRLLRWFASLDENAVPTGPVNLWSTCLERWARGHAGCDAADLSASVAEAIEAYRRIVVVSLDEARPLFDESRAKWMSGGRTAWDDYLWTVFFKDLHADPSLYFGSKLRTVLERRWYREAASRLDPDEREILLDSLVAETQRSIGDLVEWDNAKPIADAFMIDAVPDFDAERSGVDARPFNGA